MERKSVGLKPYHILYNLSLINIYQTGFLPGIFSSNIENHPKEVSEISPKQYELIVPEQANETSEVLEPAIENALLLALLEQKYITLWQYEQCCTKLRLATATKSSL